MEKFKKLEKKIEELEDFRKEYIQNFDDFIDKFEDKRLKNLLTTLKKASLLLEKESNKLILQVILSLLPKIKQEQRKKLKEIWRYII